MGKRLSCALSIAGLDPGGGAGIAADLRAFGAAGVFGCAAVAVVTIQSTSGVRESIPIASAQVVAQVREVLKYQRVRAFKTGALGSADNVRAVADLLAIHRAVPAIVDPVMLPTRGRARLLAERALDAMRSRLVPRATLVTANAHEAEALTGKRVTSVSEAHDAALRICAMGAHAALVKGGHLAVRDAVDVLAFGGEVIELRAKRLKISPVHGSGCTLSSLIAGRIAHDPRDPAASGGELVLEAVRWAKRVHHRSLADARDVGGDLDVLVP